MHDTIQPGPELAAALAAFQAEAPTVHKGKTAKVPTKSGGSYSYDYADLADVAAAARPVLAKHGLSFVAAPRMTEHGYELAGVLLHKSGQGIVGALPIKGNDPQQLGSALTYMRRYLLGCLTGIVTDDDDDATAATHAPPPPKQETPAETAARGIRDARNAETVHQVVAWAQSQGVDVEQQATAKLDELSRGAAA